MADTTNLGELLQEISDRAKAYDPLVQELYAEWDRHQTLWSVLMQQPLAIRAEAMKAWTEKAHDIDSRLSYVQGAKDALMADFEKLAMEVFGPVQTKEQAQ